MIYHVVAMANNRVIGKNNKLPWHFSSDLKFFKNLTMGQTLIMGRKTFESVGKPLPGRENFVISRKSHSEPHACHPEQSEGSKTEILRSAQNDRALSSATGKEVRFFTSVDDALKKVSTEKVFIIGGASIFEQTLNKIDGIYMTRIHADFEGDTFYPEIPKNFSPEQAQLLQENPKIEVIFYKKKD